MTVSLLRPGQSRCLRSDRGPCARRRTPPPRSQEPVSEGTGALGSVGEQWEPDLVPQPVSSGLVHPQFGDIMEGTPSDDPPGHRLANLPHLDLALIGRVARSKVGEGLLAVTDAARSRP